MSKAFTRESDDDLPELPTLRPASASLPPGVPNYLTSAGAARIRKEIEQLSQTERPALLAVSRANGDKEPLLRLNQRLRLLEDILRTAVIPPAPTTDDHQARFGSTVGVRDSEGNEETYRLVGVDETDVDQGWISWLSPLGKSLINRQLGEQVQIRLPGGLRQLTILRVEQGSE